MKGYIIYDAKSGELRHHGVCPELPEPSKGQTLLEITPEQEASIPPARGKRFVIPTEGKSDEAIAQKIRHEGELTVALLGLHILVERDAEPAQASTAESSLEAAIRENTEAVRAMTARLDRLFSR